MPKESYLSDLQIERYENQKKIDWVSVFRGQRRKKKEKEKKNGRRAAEGGDRRQTPVDHRLKQRSSSDVSTRVACKPGQTATRAEPTGPGWAGRPRLHGSKRAWRLRLAPSRTRGYALPTCCWRVSARGMANLARLFSVCPIFVLVPILILFLRE